VEVPFWDPPTHPSTEASCIAATSIRSETLQQHANVHAAVLALPGSLRPMRRADREPHTLSNGCDAECHNAAAGGGDGVAVGNVSLQLDRLSHFRATITLSSNAGATMVQAPPPLTSLTPAVVASAPAKAAAPSTLSPVGECEAKYQGHAPMVANEGDAGQGASAGEWESPRVAPPVPTHYSPHMNRLSGAAAAPGPAARCSSGGGVGYGHGYAVPSPVVRAKDHLRHFFLSGTPRRADATDSAGCGSEGGGGKWVEDSPQPRRTAPAPLFALGLPPDGDGNEGPRAEPPLPCPQDPASANRGRVEGVAYGGGSEGQIFGSGRPENLSGSGEGVVVRLPKGEVIVISEDTYDFTKPHRGRVMNEEWESGSDHSEGEDSLAEGGGGLEISQFSDDAGDLAGAGQGGAQDTTRNRARRAVLQRRQAREAREERREARQQEAHARHSAWMILAATPADVLRQEWPRHSPPFWMAIALEKADAPLLRRQRAAVREVLAMERARLGKEVCEVWDKLLAALLELDYEILLQEIGQERLETREERRACARSRARSVFSTASRSRSREVSRDKGAQNWHGQVEPKPRSGPPMRLPSAAMYKRGRGDGPSLRGSLREQARSASRSQERGRALYDAVASEARSSRDLGAGVLRGEKDRGKEDEGQGMMSWVVDAVDPAQFRTLLLQNLVCKLRLRHALVALGAYAKVSAIAVAATAGLAQRLPVACRLWGWSALRHVQVEARQQRELADLHLSSVSYKRHHRALLLWRDTAAFKNRLFLLAASARLSHTRLLKSRAIGIWRGSTADVMLSRSQHALASSLLVMVMRGKVLSAWRRYARTHAQRRAAVLRFAEGVGRAELRLLEQQRHEQHANDEAAMLSRAGSPRSASASSSAALGSVTSARSTTCAAAAAVEAAAQASRARAHRQMLLQTASTHIHALALRRDSAARMLAANCTSSFAAHGIRGGEDAVVPVAAAGNRRAMEARDGWRDKHIADSSDKLHGGLGAKEETSVLVLGERHQGQGALAAARARFLHSTAKGPQEVVSGAFWGSEGARGSSGGWKGGWRGVPSEDRVSSDDEGGLEHGDATSLDEGEWSADDAYASCVAGSVGGAVEEKEGRRRARGGPSQRPQARKVWKESVRAVHRGRLLKVCVHEWREALLVAVAERVFSARRLRHLALVWVSAASTEAKNIAALRRRVTARRWSAAKLSAMLSWALCCAAIGLGRRATQREAFSLLCTALLALVQDREAFALAARRTMLRSKTLRRWLSFMRGRATALALLLQGQELYRRHLLLGKWSRWWIFARENARFRRGVEALASRCRRSRGRWSMARWARRSRERALQVQSLKSLIHVAVIVCQRLEPFELIIL
jgi:hypothetical protein